MVLKRPSTGSGLPDNGDNPDPNHKQALAKERFAH